MSVSVLANGKLPPLEHPERVNKAELQYHPFRKLIFSPMIEEEAFKKHLLMTYKGLVYSTRCLKGPGKDYIE